MRYKREQIVTFLRRLEADVVARNPGEPESDLSKDRTFHRMLTDRQLPEMKIAWVAVRNRNTPSEARRRLQTVSTLAVEIRWRPAPDGQRGIGSLNGYHQTGWGL